MPLSQSHYFLQERELLGRIVRRQGIGLRKLAAFSDPGLLPSVPGVRQAGAAAVATEELAAVGVGFCRVVLGGLDRVGCHLKYIINLLIFRSQGENMLALCICLEYTKSCYDSEHADSARENL